MLSELLSKELECLELGDFDYLNELTEELAGGCGSTGGGCGCFICGGNS